MSNPSDLLHLTNSKALCLFVSFLCSKPLLLLCRKLGMEALEIPLISTISGFEAGLNSLHNPSFVSCVIDFVDIDESFLKYNFWTWGALILAILATFSGVINKTRLFILRLWRQQRTVDSEHLLRPLLDDDDDDDDDDQSRSSSSSNDEDELPTSPFDNQRTFDEDFRVAGSSNYEEDQRHNNRLKLRRIFSWSDFTSGKSVVKLWDGLGLGLRFESSSTESIVSMWDMYKDEIISSFHGAGERQIPTISRVAPSVMLTAGTEESGNVAVRVWDARVGSQIPTVFAEWQPRWRSIAGVDSSEADKKVYVINDSSSVAVTDMRKVGFPLESEEDTWWDADAVIVPDGDREGCCIDGSESSPVKSRGSVVSRCRRAVKSYLF